MGSNGSKQSRKVVKNVLPVEVVKKQKLQRAVFLSTFEAVRDNITAENINAFQPPLLCVASQNGNLSIVKLLVDSGASVNAADEDGSTPLLRAAGYRHYDVVAFLTEMGADLRVRVKDKSVLAYAHVEMMKVAALCLFSRLFLQTMPVTCTDSRSKHSASRFSFADQ
jgi:ankyrin repeat protein